MLTVKFSDYSFTSLPSLSKNVISGDYFGIFENNFDAVTSDTATEDRDDHVD